MTTETTQTRALGMVNARSPRFVPATGWPELEAARTRHERALDEIRAARAEEARMKDRHKAARAQEAKAAGARILDGEAPAGHGAEDARRAEVDAMGARLRAAWRASEQAIAEALGVLEEHGEAWAAEIAAKRAAALAEREELLAKAAALEATANADDRLERWITQARTVPTPQPFGAVAA